LLLCQPFLGGRALSGRLLPGTIELLLPLQLGVRQSLGSHSRITLSQESAGSDIIQQASVAFFHNRIFDVIDDDFEAV
jgi:hypothetical protein